MDGTVSGLSNLGSMHCWIQKWQYSGRKGWGLTVKGLTLPISNWRMEQLVRDIHWSRQVTGTIAQARLTAEVGLTSWLSCEGASPCLDT